MKINKLALPIMAAAAAISVAACSSEAVGAKANAAPVIECSDSYDCYVEQAVDLLDMVRALDDEDGDLTSAMAVSISPNAPIADGVAYFSAAGEYTATFSVEDSAGLAATRTMDITVHPRDIYKRLKIFEDYSYKFDEGMGASGTVSVREETLVYSVASFSDKDYAMELTGAPFTVDDLSGDYVITFKATATKPVTAIFVIPTYGGWDPTLTWQRITIGPTQTEFRFSIAGIADKGAGPYFALFQFGDAANTAYTNVEIEISELNLEINTSFEDA